MTTSFRDVELLSAYLDGQLNRSDSAVLESRLASEASLRGLLDDLRVSRRILHDLPKRGAPRNFLLTPRMAGLKPPEPGSYPIFRLATGLAFLLFIASFAVNGFAPVSAPHLAAVPAFGLGGGAAAPQEAAPVASAAPLQSLSPLSASPTETSGAAKNNTTGVLGTPALGIAPGAIQPTPLNSLPQPDQARTINQEEPPVPVVWQLGLGMVALICGLAAWLLRRGNDRNFRRNLEKKQ
jgi:hypothetical protein